MEALTKRYAILIQSVETLKESIDILSNPAYKEILNHLHDSAIQRFEYTIDLFWKFLKLYLQEREKVTLEKITPRFILRDATSAGIITPQEYSIFSKALDDYGITSQAYDEEQAREIMSRIPDYSSAFEVVLVRLKNDLNE